MRVSALMLGVVGVVVQGVGCVAVGESIEGGFADVGDDTTSRFFHRAGMLDSGLVMVSGGMRLQLLPPSLVSLDDLSFYDPATESFSVSFTPTGGGGPVVPLLATARSSHTQTTLLDGRVLMTGGHAAASGSSPGTPIASVELFDPATGGVGGGPEMSGPRTGHTATRLGDGRVVIAGGGGGGGGGGVGWQVFSTDPDAFSAEHAMTSTRTRHAAVLLPDHDGPGLDRVLLVGGAGTGPNTMELLDPATGGASSLTATLAVGVDDLGALRLDDGSVLIVGGQNVATGNTVDDTYLYDPVGDRISSLPPPPDRPNGIADHALVRLGRFAAIFGGEQQVSGVDTELDYAAVFDPAAGDWVFLSAMNHPHDDFAAIVLPGGDVLLIDGGVPFGGQELPSNAVEVFMPVGVRPPDIDGSGDVGFTDLVAVLSDWGPCGAEYCPADLDFDTVVGFTDLVAVLAAWGPCS